MTTLSILFARGDLDRLDQVASITINQLEASILSARDLVAQLGELRAQILSLYQQNNFGLDNVQAEPTPTETPDAQSAVEAVPGAASPVSPGPEDAPGQGETVPPGKRGARRRRPPQG